MADQLPTFNDDSIQWMTATSKNGVPFEFGVRKDAEVPESRASGEPIESGSPIPVYWEVGNDTWKSTTGEVLGRGIRRYRLYPNGPVYSYILEFTNTQGYSFTFWDESEDYYKVTTIINGNHYVKYNSDKPTIIYVQ